MRSLPGDIEQDLMEGKAVRRGRHRCEHIIWCNEWAFGTVIRLLDGGGSD